jgi:hypothetical protein
VNSAALNEPLSRARFILLAAAASLGAIPQLCAELPGTNQIAPHTTTQTLRVPLNDERRWHALKYDKRTPHTLRFTESGLEISVRRSAMPLLCPLPQAVRVNSIHVKGRIIGSIEVTPEKQGKKGYDDYSLRVGLVEPGATTLTARERRAAADWVKALFDLAPAGRGITKVHFLNLGVDRSEIGRTRQHPMSKLLEEEVVAAPQSDGSFDFVRVFSPPMEVCAVWISTDGDDTKSSFQTIINQLDFEILPQ